MWTVVGERFVDECVSSDAVGVSTHAELLSDDNTE